MEPATAAPLDAQPRDCSPAEPDSYTGTFCGREIAAYLGACPAAEDMVLIASELAANAVVHTRSRGGSFIVRCQLSPEEARIEVEDLGGPWRQRWNSGDRPHGLDIIEALTGRDGWGIQVTGTGGRIVWACLSLSR
jgi:hypothetical protein